MATESPEQVRQRHIRDMGSELGPVYHALWNEVAWLHVKWNQYRQLYAHSPERVAFLNKVAGHFFGLIQDTLYDDVLLHLARLTDRPSFRKYEHLTLQRLPGLVSESEPALISELEELVEAARRACQAAKSSRDQRIAHTDLERALGLASFDDRPSRSSVEAAMRAVVAVLNRLEVHCWQSETAYQHFSAVGGEADTLVYYLLKGVRAEEQWIERLREGKPLPEDRTRGRCDNEKAGR